VSGGTFAELDDARAAVLAEGARFVEELEPILADSLRHGFERLCVAQAAQLARSNASTMAALDDAVARAVRASVDAAIARLRAPDVWLAPLTAPDLPPRRPFGWPGWFPEWVARILDRAGPERVELGDLDDPSNRVWVAISGCSGPLDDVLEEFGFRPGRPRIGGGRFDVGPRTLPRLDPSGVLRGPWKRYRIAYELLVALTVDPRGGS
jgi:hypothetical protein